MIDDFDVIDYDEAFIDKFVYNGVEKDAIGPVDAAALIRVYSKYGPVYMGIHKARCIGAAGILPLSQGVGQGWTFLNSDMYPFVTSWYREMKHRTEKIMDDLKLHRVHTFVLDNPVTTRMIEALGYEREGLLRCYGANKENFFMYSKIRG